MSELDHTLTAQFIVAVAGETGEDRSDPRLGWWKSDLASEFGGLDLFRRLLPATADWAALQGAREAARRTDEALRRKDHEPDRIFSLFNLGFELDERLDERLQALKHSGVAPTAALPGLAGHVDTGWDRDRFLSWLQAHEHVDTTATSVGRLIKGPGPVCLEDRITQLLAALTPLSGTYPLPHFRRTP